MHHAPAQTLADIAHMDCGIRRRLDAGFAKRLSNAAAARNLQDHNGPLAAPSAGKRRQVDLRAFSKRVLSMKISYSEYLSSIVSLLPPQLKDLMLSYYFSGDLVDQPDRLLQTNVLNDEQYSVVIQTLILHKKFLQEEYTSSLLAGISLLTNYLYRDKQKIWSFEDLEELFDIGLSAEAKGLGRARAILAEVKDRYIHVIGPDIISLLQKLIDPNFLFDKQQVEYAVNIAQCWRIAPLVHRLFELRSFRNLPCDRLAKELFSSHEPDIRFCEQKDSLCAAVELLKEVQKGIDQVNIGHIIRSILGVYEVDPEVLTWVDWSSVHEATNLAERRVGFDMALLHLLMGQPIVGEHFPDVKLAEGDGAFESSLRGAIRDLPTKSLASIAEAAGHLGEKSRALFLDALLRHETASMISSLIGYDPPWAKKLARAQSLTFDVRAAALRRDAARVFHKGGLISAQFANAIVHEAEATLRISYLRGRQLKGLVSLDLIPAQTLISSDHAPAVRFIRKLLDSTRISDAGAYLEKVSSDLAASITDYILLDGPSDLRTTISDSLRHGQLPNRFLQAFDKTLDAAAPSIRNMTEFFEQLSDSAGDLLWLVEFRSELISGIERFNHECLSVIKNGPLYLDIHQAIKIEIRARIDNAILKADSESVTLWQELIVNRIEDFLADAREELKQRIGRILGNARMGIPRENRSFCSVVVNGGIFVEQLGPKFQEAMDDAGRWIAIAKLDDSSQKFRLEDIVQLCLMTHTPVSGKPLSLSTTISERTQEGVIITKRDYTVSGKYLELFETICKNLISNCFKHSGLGTETRANVEFILGSDHLTIVLRNELSVARKRALGSVLDELQKKASKPSIREASRDRASGISKIAWACNKVFKSLPDIRIALTPGSLAFKMDITIKHPGVTIVES